MFQRAHDQRLFCLHDHRVGHDETWLGYGRDPCDMALGYLRTVEQQRQKSLEKGSQSETTGVVEGVAWGTLEQSLGCGRACIDSCAASRFSTMESFGWW